MSTERDELAKLLFTTDNRDAPDPDHEWEMTSRHNPPHAEAYYIMADAILAAGHRKPRQVTTVEELDALPVGSAILTARGHVYLGCRTERHGVYKTLWQDDAIGRMSSKWFAESDSLPATVLHVGGAE